MLWPNTHIILTGGAGFLGSAIREVLIARGAHPDHLVLPRSGEYDLRSEASCARMLRAAMSGSGARRPVIIHAAARSGGLGAVRANPGGFFRDNAAMALNLIEQARVHGLCLPHDDGRFVMVGHMTSYPATAPMPLREDDLFNGAHDENAAPLGVAKLCAWQMLDAYHHQYGFRSAYVIPVNLYGPGDDFDPATSHFAGALIRRCLETHASNAPTLTCWGDGTPTRDFLFVEDAAEGVVRAAECDAASSGGPVPINLCPGVEYSIREVVDHIVECVGYKGAVEWDTTRPKGQARRCLDAQRADELLGWRAQVSLEEGLRRTIEWCRPHFG